MLRELPRQLAAVAEAADSAARGMLALEGAFWGILMLTRWLMFETRHGRTQ